MKKAALILISSLAAALLQAGGVAAYKDCYVIVTNGVLHLEPLPRNRMFTAVLDGFSVEPARGSTESFILSGRVVSNNTGLPQQGVAISTHAAGRPARLAAISDVDGAFRFRVWIIADAPKTNTIPLVNYHALTNSALDLFFRGEGPHTLSLPSINGGDLCIGGAFDTNRSLVSGIVSRYSLDKLKSPTKIEKTPK